MYTYEDDGIKTAAEKYRGGGTSPFKRAFILGSTAEVLANSTLFQCRVTGSRRKTSSI
jgi:hypothetical protein